MDEHQDIVEYLVLQAGVNVDQVDTYQERTLLYKSIEMNRMFLANWLLDNTNCNINKGTTDGYSPLHIACQYGRFDIVKKLVEKVRDT